MISSPRPGLVLFAVLGVALLAGCSATGTDGSSPADDGGANVGANARPLTVGATAPDAEVVNLDGKKMKLSEALGGKKSVLVFYRGGWCPFCNVHLADLGRNEKEVRRRGYQIIAVSPESTQDQRLTKKRDGVGYTLLSDPNADAMGKFGVAYKLEGGPDGTRTLPVPSLYVIDEKGKIVYAHSDTNYSVRMTGAQLLSVLK